MRQRPRAVRRPESGVRVTCGGKLPALAVSRHTVRYGWACEAQLDVVFGRGACLPFTYPFQPPS